MGLVDSIAQKIGEAIKPERNAANDAILERTAVNPEDVFRRGHWENSRGQKIRINREKNTFQLYPNDAVLMDLDDSQVLQDIQERLESGGFTFVPATTPEKESAEAVVVVPETVLADEVFSEQAKQIDVEMADVMRIVEADLEEIREAIDQAKVIVDTGLFPPMQQVIDELVGRTEAAIEGLNGISLDDDQADERVAETGGFDDTYVVGKKERIASLGEISEEVAVLKKSAVAALQSLEKLQKEFAKDKAPAVEKGRKGKKSPPVLIEEGEADEKRGGRVRTARRTPRSARVFSDEGGLPPAPTRRGVRVGKREDKESEGTAPQEEGAAEVTPRQALEQFLQRPDGRRILDTYWDLMKGEWQRFCAIMDASKQHRTLDEVLDIWESDERLFPKLRERLLTDMTTKRSVTREDAERILFAFFDDLHQDFLNDQGE